MRTRSIAAITLTVFAAGCATAPKPAADLPQDGLIRAMRDASLEKADGEYSAGRYREAIIEYSKVLGRPASEDEYLRARIGLARTCLKMGSPAAAIARAGMPPENPATENGRELSAVLGEALLRENRTTEAETALRRALAGGKPGASPSSGWRAACHANLACACLKNGKTQEAADLYRQAAELYRERGRPGESRRAAAMAERLRRILGEPPSRQPPAKETSSSQNQSREEKTS